MVRPGNALMGGLAGLGAAWQLDPRVSFWQNPKAWPDNTKACIFSGHAIQEYGKHLIGESWSDESARTTLTNSLPEKLTVYMERESLIRGVELLRSHSTAYSMRMAEKDFSSPDPIFGQRNPLHSAEDGSDSFGDFPSQKEWSEACEIAMRESEESWSKYRPFAMLCLRLSRLCRDGELLSATRPRVGGALTALDSSCWNYEHAWLRFESCRMNPVPPHASKSDNDQHWIFFERASFEKLLADERPSGAQDADEQAVSDRVEKKKSTAGRKRRPHLELVTGELIRIVHFEGIPDSMSHHELARRLSEWAMEIHGRDIPVGTIRYHLPSWLSPLQSEE